VLCFLSIKSLSWFISQLIVVGTVLSCSCFTNDSAAKSREPVAAELTAMALAGSTAGTAFQPGCRRKENESSG